MYGWVLGNEVAFRSGARDKYNVKEHTHVVRTRKTIHKRNVKNKEIPMLTHTTQMIRHRHHFESISTRIGWHTHAECP